MIIASNRMWGDQRHRQLELIQKAQAFLSALERECTRVGLVGDTPGEGGEEEDDEIEDWDGQIENEDGEPVGKKLKPRPGETIADAICRSHCQDEYNYWQEQLRWLRNDEQAKSDAEEEERRIRERIHEKERDLSDAESEYNQLKDFLMTPHGPHISSFEEQKMVQSHQRMRYIERWILPDLRSDIERLHNKLKQAQKLADIMKRAVERQREREKFARKEYFDCLKSCIKQAKEAGEEITIEIPKIDSQSSLSSSKNNSCN
jgi:hypothetical protein